ncbi:hypothetical protein [Geobacter pickeringii]|uniref:Uncharacterized protein n=1 Tax=Geobacter pickeringii TaxID=345632 RepID=A0A0B5BC95_9BACT|nr:hypothetical protein [Geobacter pickeringii]AJE02185.1 hypothetical protein GPICK_01265 [Geobacter pickeringii]
MYLLRDMPALFTEVESGAFLRDCSSSRARALKLKLFSCLAYFFSHLCVTRIGFEDIRNNLHPELVQEANAKEVQVIRQNAADFAAEVRSVIESMRAQGKSLGILLQNWNH